MSDSVALPIPSSGTKPAPKLSHGNSAASIGNSFIAGEGVCQDGEKSSRCFLPGETRNLLFMGVEARLVKMAGMVASACNQLRINELIKKPEELDPLTEMVIDLATTALGKFAGKMINKLRGDTAKTLISIGVGRIGVEDEDRVKEADNGTVELAIKGATSLTKKGVSAVLKADDKADLEADKAEAMDYLLAIQDGASKTVSGISNQVFGSLGDADRILLFLTLDQLQPSAVYNEIAAGLGRYRASPASKIGRTTADRHMEKVPKGTSMMDGLDKMNEERERKHVDHLDDIRDTKLVMVTTDNEDAQPQLYYYKRDYDGGIAQMPGGDAFMDPKSSKAQDVLDQRAKDDDFVQYKPVEPEFYDMAIANNQRAWGVPYETRMFHDGLAPRRPKAPTPAPSKTSRDLAAQVATSAMGGGQAPKTPAPPSSNAGHDLATQAATSVMGGGVQAPKKSTMMDDQSVFTQPVVDSPVMRTD